MSIQFLGMIGHRLSSETIAPVGPIFDRDYIVRFAQTHEAAGFDRLLVGHWSDQPDGFLVTALAGLSTQKIQYLLAHRPGFVSPTLAARKFATLEHLLGGRLAVHIISGGNDAEQRRRAVARFAPDRLDDLLWENDLVAHRIYGTALEAKEPPSGSGIDVWAKRVRWPFMDRQLKFPNYHTDRGEGLDFYDVGRTRGAASAVSARCGSTMTGIDLEVGVRASSAKLDNGTSALVSG